MTNCELSNNFQIDIGKRIFQSLCWWLFAAIFCVNSNAQTRMDDSLALVNLYNTTNGPGWTNNWNLNSPMDNWYGVTLLNNRVNCLDLDGAPACNTVTGLGNNLTGSLPDLNLRALQFLFLSGNQLVGTIPNFSNLQNLVQIRIGANQLTGGVPSFNNLPNLAHLEFGGNQLTGPIANFTNMPALQTIRFEFNQLSGTIPSFNNLPNLNYLSLNDNLFSGGIPDFAVNTSLEWLFLSNNNLKGVIPDYSALPAFRWLEIFDNQFTFEDISGTRMINENHCNNNNGNYYYSPQDSISTIETITIFPNNNVTIDLQVDELVSSSTYTWYKDGTPIATTNINEVTIVNFQLANEGVYTCEITNPQAPNLTLESRPKTLALQNTCSIIAQATNASCSLPNGSVTASAIATGGASNFTYQWSDGTIGPTINNLPQGSYTVTATDATACSITSTAIVSFQEVPVIEWEKNYGGSMEDLPYSIIQTKNGGYIVAGRTLSTNIDISNSLGNYDFWIHRLSPTGTLQWEKSLGGSLSEEAYSIIEVADGFVVAGQSDSNDGDVVGANGNHDYWVVKLDVSGNFVWQNALGGTSTDDAYDIKQTPDGGYIVVGQSISNNGDVSGQIGDYDFWVVKLNASGQLVWEKSYGGTGADIARSVAVTADSSYVICGHTRSNDGDVTGNLGDYDSWVIKIDNTGNLIWQNTLGGSITDNANAVKQTFDGGYIVAGYTTSLDGDVSNNDGGKEIWVFKLDSFGNLIWEKSLGGSGTDTAYDVFQRSDGSFIVVGDSDSNDLDVSGNHGNYDYWMVCLDNTGNINWQKTFGGFNNETPFSTQQTADGGIIVAGRSVSNDGDVSQNYGDFDNWIIKLNAPQILTAQCTITDPGTGNGDAETEIQAIGGTAPFTIIWTTPLGISDTISNATGIDTLRGLLGGTHFVTITDANNCTTTCNSTICDLQVNLTTTNTSCNQSNGSIVANVLFGLSPYNYLWSTGATGPAIPNLPVGSYSLTVTDGAGCIAIANTVISFTGQPILEWQKALGGSVDDYGYSSSTTNDGGFIIAGKTSSNDGDVVGNNGGEDSWIIKTNSLGVIEWKKSLGGSLNERTYAIQQTSDGGYVGSGRTSSNNGDVSGNNGGADYWVFKLDNLGNLIWQKTLGGSNQEQSFSMEETSDKGFIIAGNSNSNDGDVTSTAALDDYWIVKLDQEGNIEWENSFGGTGFDEVYSISQTKDGGYVAAGSTTSIDGDVTGNHGSYDFWVIRLNPLGDLMWQKALGGSSEDIAKSIKQTIDGGFIVAGHSGSADGDVTGNNGGNDYWIVKLDASANISWQKSIGGTGDDRAISVVLSPQGEYVIAGWSDSSNGDVINPIGGVNYWIIELSTTGTINWQKTLGGTSNSEQPSDIDIAADGGYLVTGHTGSNDIDVSGNHGGLDYWIVKLNQAPPIALSCAIFNEGTGNNDGQAEILSTDGVAPYTLSWTDPFGNVDSNTGDGTDTLSFLQIGNYFITVTDLNGCAETCSVSITCNLSANITTTNTSCNLDNGSLSAIATGGDGNYSYLWSTGAASPTIANLPMGTYNLTITDGSGCIATTSTIVSFAGEPILEWQKTLGGSLLDVANEVLVTPTGDYIVAGSSASNDGDVATNQGQYDFWIVKLDPVGNIIWKTSLGGSQYEYGGKMQETPDGGIIVAGYTNSANGAISINKGGYDIWLVKLNNSGVLEWEKTYGGSGNENTFSMDLTSDGGYVIGATSDSSNGDLTSNNGADDVWIVKLDPQGDLQWQQSYGGSGNDVTREVRQLDDGSYIVAAHSTSIDGDLTSNNGNADYWILRLDAGGGIIWQKSYGGTLSDYAESALQTADGGFIVAGETRSSDGDVAFNNGASDLWVIKLDSQGDLLWQNAIGGTNGENIQTLEQTTDGNYLISGSSRSADGDLTLNQGNQDFMLLKLDVAGNLLWQKTVGGSGNEAAASSKQAADGGYIVAGYSDSSDGDVTGHQGNSDFWIVKLNQSPILTSSITSTNISCFGGTDGSITTSVSGGVLPYSYIWSNNATTQDLSNLSAGLYSVIITEATGCTIANSTTLIEPPLFSVVNCNVINTGTGNNDAEAEVTISGGTPDYSVDYFDPNGVFVNGNITSIGIDTLRNLIPGSYLVVVTDANGCEATCSFTTCSLTASITTANASCYLDNGSLTATASGGDGNYSYLWSTGASTPSLSDLPPGTFTLTVTDGTGCSVILSSIVSFNEIPVLENEISLGGSAADLAYYGEETDDGGFIISGFTNSSDFDVSNFNGINDGWLVKLDNNLAIQWEKSFGEIQLDRLYAGKQTNDGGYIAAGFINSTTIQGNQGGADYFIVKLSTSGAIEWQRALGGTDLDHANDVIQTTNGDYVITGVSSSSNGDVVGNNGSGDFWIVRLDQTGNIIWQNALGGSGDESSFSVKQTADGGFIAIGNSNSVDGDVTGNNGLEDYWVVKLNSDGSLNWQKSLGGSGSDFGEDIQQTADGGYIATGYTASNDGDVSSNNGNRDYWVVKLDQTGNIEWQKTYGNVDTNLSYGISQFSDGSFAVAGYSVVAGGAVSNHFGASDFWILKLDNFGSQIWEKSFGGSTIDIPRSINQTSDGGLVVTGYSSSTDVDASSGNGNLDYWVVKLNRPQISPLNVNLTSIDPPCGASPTGSITSTTTGGVAPYTYLWSNAETTANLTGLTAGNYDLTITDANQCEAFGMTTLVSSGSTLVLTSIQEGSACFDSILVVNLAVAGGTPPYDFIWSTGATTEDVTAITDGLHSVTVTDNVGCTDILQENIFLYQPVTLTISIDNNVNCSGGSDGQVTVLVDDTDGIGDYNYFWSNGTTANNFYVWSHTVTGLTAGNYSVTVVNNSSSPDDCYAIADFMLGGINALVTLPSAITPVSCFGLSDGQAAIFASGGTPPYTYLWDDGSTGFTLTGLPVGVYNATITDANGCFGSVTNIVTSPTPLQYSNTQTPTTCGQSNGAILLTASGGTTPYTFSIDNGNSNSTNPNFTNLAAANYPILVTDANGCTQTDLIILDDFPGPTIDNVVAVDPACMASNGSITITASSPGGPVEYSLDNNSFQTGNVFNGAPQGNYTVYVRDVNGCIATSSTVLTEANGPQITNITTNNALCQEGTGSFILSATGTATPLLYSLDNGTTTQTTNTFNNVSSGSYVAYVSDVNGCTQTIAVSMGYFPGPAINNISQVNPSCMGSNGSISIAASGPGVPFQYSLNNTTFQSNTTFTGLPQGNYMVYVEDVNGCITTSSLVLTETTGPTISNVATTDDICQGTNGSITISATGTSTPLLYSIDNGVTTQANSVFSNLATGNYVVYVADANGCTQTSNAFVSNAAGPSIVATNTTDPTCGQSNGTITIGSTPGTGSTTFSIDNGNSYSMNNIFNGLPAGNYDVVVLDANSCGDTTTVTLSDLPPPSIDSIQTSDPVCNLDNGEVTVFTSLGMLPLQFSINGGTPQVSNLFTNLAAGSHSILVEDASGCTVTTSFSLTNNPPPNFSGLQGVTATYCGKSIGKLTISANGQAPPLMYAINNGTPQSSNIFSNLSAGQYDVAVTDANGCSVSQSFTIFDLPGPTVSISAQDDPACGMAIGSVTVQSTGGLPFYEYSIDNGPFSSNNVFSGLMAGTYEIVVSDFNTCLDTLSFVLSDIAGPMITQINTTNPTCGSQNGALIIAATGPTLPLLFSLDGITYSASNVFDQLGASNYTVWVQDTNGCTTSTQQLLSDTGFPDISGITTSPPTCGNANGSITITASNGTPPYLYSIDNNGFQGNNTFNNLNAGSFFLEVKDANDCLSDTTIVLQDLNGPILDNIITVNPACGLVPGSITIEITGGAGPFNYSIDAGVIFQTSNVFNNLPAGSYSILVSDANNCELTGSTTLTNLSGPTVLVMNSTPTDCNQSVGSLQVVAGGGTSPYSFLWNTIPVETTATITGLANGVYTVTITDYNSCITTAAGLVDEPNAFFADLGPDISVCGLLNEVLDPDVPNGSYLWSNGSTTETITATMFGVYSITATDMSNCISVDSVELLESFFTPQVIGDTVILENGEIELFALGGDQYSWWPAGGLSCTNCATPVASPLDSTTYFVEIQQAGGCIDTLTVNVGVVDSYLPFVEVPTAFSPNGDGRNDFFTVPFIEFFPENSFTVINRWGDVVYTANPYQNDWAGTYDGKPLPQGTYYYLLELNVNEYKAFKGPITILK